jgi:predicted RecA/RadA family phage recombinase
VQDVFDTKGQTAGRSKGDDVSPAAGAPTSAAEQLRPSRRTVVRGAAWATPVVLVAAAAPTVAASVTVALKFAGDGCKLPGNSNDLVKGYVFGITIVNSGTVPADITINSLVIDGDDLGVAGFLIKDGSTCATLGGQFQVPAGTGRDIALYTRNYTKSQAGTLTLSYTYDPVGPAPAVTPPSITATVTGNTWNGGCRPFPNYSCGIPSA